MNDQRLEIGLKTEIARQSGLKRFESTCGDHTFKHLVMSWEFMIGKIDNSILEEMIWSYFLNSPQQLYVQLNSSLLGKTTTIHEYENAKGRKHQAHFRENGTYLGPVSKFGVVPIPYETAIPLSREQFTFNIESLSGLGGSFENAQKMFKYKL